MAPRGVRALALTALLSGAAACGGGEGGTAAGEDASPPDAAAPVTEPGAQPATVPQTPGDSLALPQQP